MELGKFEFEKSEKLKEENEEVIAGSGDANRSSVASSGSGTKDGLSLDHAANLVAAMSVDPKFATKASRPSSTVISSGGLYGKLPPGFAGSSPSLPPLSLPSSSLEMNDVGVLSSPRQAAPTDSEKDIVKALSGYLNQLASQSSVRNSAPWKRFFFVRTDDLSSRTADQTERAGVKPMNEDMAKDKDGGPGDISLSAQRKKLLRRSRSMGEELVGLFAGLEGSGKGHEVPSSTNMTTTHKPKDTKHLQEDPKPLHSSAVRSDLLQPEDLAAISLNSAAMNTTPAVGSTNGIHTPKTASESNTDTETISNEADSEQDPMSASLSPGLAGDILPRRKRRGRRHVNVDDFELIRVLGKGCAGKVGVHSASKGNASHSLTRMIRVRRWCW